MMERKAPHKNKFCTLSPIWQTEKKGKKSSTFQVYEKFEGSKKVTWYEKVMGRVVVPTTKLF